MVDETIIHGNGQQVLQALQLLKRYEGKRSKLDVSMTPTDAIIVYLNAAEPKFQPKIKPEDIEALEALGFIDTIEGDYRVFLLR